MELEDIFYRIDRKKPSLKGYRAIYSDGHTEFLNIRGDTIKVNIWGYIDNLDGSTAMELNLISGKKK